MTTNLEIGTNSDEQSAEFQAAKPVDVKRQPIATKESLTDEISQLREFQPTGDLDRDATEFARISGRSDILEITAGRNENPAIFLLGVRGANQFFLDPESPLKPREDADPESVRTIYNSTRPEVENVAIDRMLDAAGISSRETAGFRNELMSQFEPTGNLQNDAVEFMRMTNREHNIQGIQDGTIEPRVLLGEIQAFYQKEIEYYNGPDGQSDPDAQQRKDQAELQLGVIDSILSQEKSGTTNEEEKGATKPEEPAKEDPEKTENKIRLEKLIQTVDEEYTGLYQERLAQTGRAETLYGELSVTLGEIKKVVEGTNVVPKIEKAENSAVRSHDTTKEFLEMSAGGCLFLRESTIYHLRAIQESGSDLSDQEIAFAENIVQSGIEFNQDMSQKISANLDRLDGQVNYANSLLIKAREKVGEARK